MERDLSPLSAATFRTVQRSQSQAESEPVSSNPSSSSGVEVRSGLPAGLDAAALEVKGDDRFVFVHVQGDSKNAPPVAERVAGDPAGNALAAVEGAVVVAPPALAVPAPLRRRAHVLAQAHSIFVRSGYKDFAARVAGGAVRSAVVAALANAGPASSQTRMVGIFAGVLTALPGARVLSQRSRVAGLATAIGTLTVAAGLLSTRPRLRIGFTGQLAGAYATELFRELLGCSSAIYLQVAAVMDQGQRARFEREPLSAVMGPGKVRATIYVLSASIALVLRMWRPWVLPPSEIDNAMLAPRYAQGDIEDRWLTDFHCEMGQAMLELWFAGVDAVAVAVEARQNGVELQLGAGPDRPTVAPGRVFRSSSVRFALDILTLLLAAALATVDPDENPGLVGLGLFGLAVIQGLKRLRAHAAEDGVSNPMASAWNTLNSNVVQVGPGSGLRRWPRVQPAE